MFPEFTKEQLPNEILKIEIKGLCLAQDLNLNSITVRCVIFSQGKGSINSTIQDNDEEKASISVRVRHVMLQKLAMAFANNLRYGDQKCANEPIIDEISDRM